MDTDFGIGIPAPIDVDEEGYPEFVEGLYSLEFDVPYGTAQLFRRVGEQYEPDGPPDAGWPLFGCYQPWHNARGDKRKNAKNGFSPVVKVSAKNLGNKVEIRIRDNGNGIPPDVIDRMFNPFFTTKPAGVGTGLGLSLTYDIITQVHKGEIDVDTKEGEFAEFIIRIPRDAESNGGSPA